MLLKTNNFSNYANSENLKLITDSNEINTILKNSQTIIKKHMPMGMQNWALIKYHYNKYLYVHSMEGDFLIKKERKIGAPDFILILWATFILSILFLYISIRKAIYPLKILRKNIEQFKKGNMNINFNLKSKDEVGFLAKEFQEAIDNIKKTSNLRQWFLRNVAHELKTPIAKGMIATELLENQDRKNVFLRIFKRLDALINELLSVEEIATKNIDESVQCYEFSKILERAKKLLFLEGEKVKYSKILNYKLNIDEHLFTIAIKNLIDNGIKFSPDKTVTVLEKDQKIYFLNKGDKSPISPDMMFEPFSKEISTNNKEGMGLGLYVTKYILDKHKVSIHYHYESNNNIFVLDVSNIICNK